MYPKKQLAQLVLSACQFYNIDKAVISPGSRNAPLTIGFTNLKSVEVFSIVDERCAAFFALGIAQQTQRPVILVCTSGSALLNYYPAVAEAFYSRVPLLVISADRPKHLIDIGDGQTIRQENVYDNHILFSANLREADEQITHNKIAISKAIQTALFKKGPVHINVPFNEPLYETVEDLQDFNFDKDQMIKANGKHEQTLDEFSGIWNSSKKKLILVGVNFPSHALQEIVNKFAADASVLVMTETTSNLNGQNYINAIDQLISKLSEAEFENLRPEVLLTFGGMVISKRIKQFLRKYQPTHHWHVDEFVKMDTYFCLSEYIAEKPEQFLNKLWSRVGLVESDYQVTWNKEKVSRNEQHEVFFKTAAYSDLQVFDLVLQSIPNNSQVHVSNSAVIRYMQLFNVNPTVKVFCNRGTSGIDGSSSTAIGAAVASNSASVLITGDLSFFYDSNALWNNYIPNDFRIILINNAGGGIFKIIPGPKTTNALQNFETPHQLNAAHLAEMFHWEYRSAKTKEEVESQLLDFYVQTEQPKILEIFTPSDKNDSILQEYFKNL